MVRLKLTFFLTPHKLSLTTCTDSPQTKSPDGNTYSALIKKRIKAVIELKDLAANFTSINRRVNKETLHEILISLNVLIV